MGTAELQKTTEILQYAPWVLVVILLAAIFYLYRHMNKRNLIMSGSSVTAFSFSDNESLPTADTIYKYAMEHKEEYNIPEKYMSTEDYERFKWWLSEMIKELEQTGKTSTVGVGLDQAAASVIRRYLQTMILAKVNSSDSIYSCQHAILWVK